MKWGRCGARGRASQARTREALGRRPFPLRGTALTGWTRRGRRAAKAARIGEGDPSRPRPEVTAPGTEIAVMERRVASAPAQGAPTPPGVRTDGCATRRSIPLAFRGGAVRVPAQRGWKYGVPGAAKNTGDHACPFDPLVPATRLRKVASTGRCLSPPKRKRRREAGTQFWMPACAGMSGGEAIAERNVKTKPAARCQSGGWQSHGRMTSRHV